MKRKRIYIVIFALLMFFGGNFFIFKKIDAVSVNEDQQKIIRDTQRLSDLYKIKTAVEDYKKRNLYYPKLDTGTYIRGYVNSTWDGWQNFCNLIGLSNCPVDPVNLNVGCDCNIFGDDCNPADLNTNTCYNSKLSQATCAPGSYLYQYKSLNNGRNYSLGTNLEGEDDFNVESSENGNEIKVANICDGTVQSNKNSECGNNILEYGEVCDGNDKISMCTDSYGKRGRIIVECNSRCIYNNVNLIKNGSCTVNPFCGDLIKQDDEECDGGSDNLCFSYGKHDWYKNQIRYCKNCKYENNISITSSNVEEYCVGYCGDNKLNDNEECDIGVEYKKWDASANKFKGCYEYISESLCPSVSGCKWASGKCISNITTTILEDKHCGIRDGVPCLYTNTPAVFPEITGENKNNFTVRSYGFDENDNTYKYNEITYSGYGGVENKIFVNKNALFVEIKLKIKEDVDGDKIQYKFEFIDKENSNIGFFKAKNLSNLYNSSTLEEITDWVNEDAIKVGDYIVFRIYSKSKDSKDNSKIKLIDGEYAGDYKFKISKRDDWNLGQEASGNKKLSIISKTFDFYIKTTCGDFMLIKQSLNDDGRKEFCEYNANDIKFLNFKDGEPDISGDCVAINTDGKWSDEDCGPGLDIICKRELMYSGPNCVNNDFISYGSFCYKVIAASFDWDYAKNECERLGYGSKLFVVKNIRENDFIKEKINGKTWIGYYNINKIRSNLLSVGSIDGVPVNKESLIVSVEENGNREVNYNKIQSGGFGTKYEDQYVCSNACSDVGGFCGDRIVEDGKQVFGNTYITFGEKSYTGDKYNYYVGNFEECDASAQSRLQDGAGINKNDQYGCVNCKLDGGFCGDRIVNYDGDKIPNENQDDDSGYGIDFEHCDPTYMLKPEESKNDTDKRGYGSNYVCISEFISIENGNSPWIPFDITTGDPFTINDFYFSNKRTGVLKFEVNPDGICQKSSGGYCGDGVIQLSYNQMLSGDRISNGYINPVYISTNNYLKNGDATKNKNSNAFVSGIGRNEKDENVEMRIESCDPNYFVTPGESNNLTSGTYYKKTNLTATVIDDESNDFIKKGGESRLKYICDNDCSFATYGFYTSVFAYDETRTGLGFCGDGIVSAYGYGESSYGSYVVKTPAIFYGNVAVKPVNREECDPKNHIVAPNGYGYGHKNAQWFGCFSKSSDNKYIYGKDCSSFITPAISSKDLTYECTYDCKNTTTTRTDSTGETYKNPDLTNKLYGLNYCGDGFVQEKFFEECDFGDVDTQFGIDIDYSPTYKGLIDRNGDNAEKMTYWTSYGVVVRKDTRATNEQKLYFCGTQHYGYNFDEEFLYGLPELAVSGSAETGPGPLSKNIVPSSLRSTIARVLGVRKLAAIDTGSDFGDPENVDVDLPPVDETTPIEDDPPEGTLPPGELINNNNNSNPSAVIYNPKPINFGNDEFSPFDNNRKTKNRNLACLQFGGFLGDGKVQTCVINGNGFGSVNWTRCNELKSDAKINYVKNGGEDADRYYPTEDPKDIIEIINSGYGYGYGLSDTTFSNYKYGYGLKTIEYNNKYFETNYISGYGYGFANAKRYTAKKNDTTPGILILEFCDKEDYRGSTDGVYDPEYGKPCLDDGSGCRPGFYIDKGTCKLCPKGSFCEGYGYGAISCPAGSYQPEIGQNKCELCKLGHYQSNSGSIDCDMECVKQYKDADRDGHGEMNSKGQYCNPKNGRYNSLYTSSNNEDCNDAIDGGNTIYRGATEKCDQIDSNCDGNFSEGCSAISCKDAIPDIDFYSYTGKMVLCPPGGGKRQSEYNGCFLSNSNTSSMLNRGKISLTANVVAPNGMFRIYFIKEAGNASFVDTVSCTNTSNEWKPQSLHAGFIDFKTIDIENCLCRSAGNNCSAEGDNIKLVEDQNCDPERPGAASSDRP